MSDIIIFFKLQLEKFRENKSFIITYVVSLLFLSHVFFYFGMLYHANADVKEKLSVSRSELETATEELNRINTELNEKKSLYDDFIKYSGTKEYKENELEILKETVSSLDKEIQDKQTELDRLTTEVITIKNERIFSAGTYIVGTDIDAGTYDVQLVSGHGNFFASGSRSVNEMFGTDSDYYIQEYKNMCVSNGDEIEIRGSLKIKLLLK